MVRGAECIASLRPVEIDRVGKGGRGTARRSPPQRLLRVLPHSRGHFRRRFRRATHRRGIRQREFTGRASGSRTWHRPSNYNIALVTTILKLMSGQRILYRPLTGTTETQSLGIARAAKGDVTPAGEKFCEILRQILF